MSRPDTRGQQPRALTRVQALEQWDESPKASEDSALFPSKAVLQPLTQAASHAPGKTVSSKTIVFNKSVERGPEGEKCWWGRSSVAMQLPGAP